MDTVISNIWWKIIQFESIFWKKYNLGKGVIPRYLFICFVNRELKLRWYSSMWSAPVDSVCKITWTNADLMKTPLNINKNYSLRTYFGEEYSRRMSEHTSTNICRIEWQTSFTQPNQYLRIKKQTNDFILFFTNLLLFPQTRLLVTFLFVKNTIVCLFKEFGIFKNYSNPAYKGTRFKEILANQKSFMSSMNIRSTRKTVSCLLYIGHQSFIRINIQRGIYFTGGLLRHMHGYLNIASR